MSVKYVSSLTDAELLKFQHRYEAQLKDTDCPLVLDMTKKLLDDISQEIYKRNNIYRSNTNE